MTDERQHSEIDALIAAFYSAFDNRHGAEPAAGMLHDIFAPEARITRVSGATVEYWSVQRFIEPRVELLTSGALIDFHEWEIDGRTTVLGNIASRQSLYRKAGVRDGAPFGGEGQKLIHLCRIDGRWRITSLLWEDG